MSLTDPKPDTEPKPKKVYTAEEKAAILRRMRKANLIMFLAVLLIAALGIGLVYVQTQDVLITALAGAGVVGFLIYREYKVRQK